jgi:hypothetical protein
MRGDAVSTTAALSQIGYPLQLAFLTLRDRNSFALNLDDGPRDGQQTAG